MSESLGRLKTDKAKKKKQVSRATFSKYHSKQPGFTKISSLYSWANYN